MSQLLESVEAVLREAHYDTWRVKPGEGPLVFENPAVIGFVHVFPSAAALIDSWADVEQTTLRQFATRFRSAGEKAWNVYSIFLSEVAGSESELEKIEENFVLTRKIARSGVATTSEVTASLLPILPLQSVPTLEDGDLEQRLRVQLEGIHAAAFEFLSGEATPADLANLLMGSP